MTEQTITVKVTDKDLIEILTKGVAELKEENIILKKELDDASKLLDGLTIPELLELVKYLNEENQSLKQSFDLINKVRKELIEENEKLQQTIAETEKMVQSTYDELTKLRCFKKNILRIKHSWDYLMEAIQYD